MLQRFEKILPGNRKRKVLIVDDEQINRELLGMILGEKYEILYAADGKEALKLIRENKDTLSLVLLDLLMPEMDGMEALAQMKQDPEISTIPVIVLTSEKDAEVQSLSAGAIDFIPKPYPKPEVILARVQRTIQLFEGWDIIRLTEFDQLTGLYNREYFYRYAEQFRRHNKDASMDAIVIDINRFHVLNDRYGKAYGDVILKTIGNKISEVLEKNGGIGCREKADTFFVYCPHREDYYEILESVSSEFSKNNKMDKRIRLRMGVCPDDDRVLDIERRFDRAKLAANTIRDSFTKSVAVYDKALYELELFEDQLLNDFQTGIEEGQFLVYYQPKFDIRPTVPVMASAEALVRWKHPEHGMISPSVFIPLFEHHGLIQELDQYVWRTVAAQLKEWKERIGFTVPVSVNVSRIDMYDPKLVTYLEDLLKEHGLDGSDIFLEITESAYTQDSEQIIETVHRMRGLGLRVEMDDFGTGYSSLNMLSALPIDALKLDLHFIRDAFSGRKNTRMLKVILDIAEMLSVPTIAEGVETAEQMMTLRSMGCDYVQGYYFSKPIPAEEYEEFLLKRKELSEKELNSGEEQNQEKELNSRKEHDSDTELNPEKKLSSEEEHNSGNELNLGEALNPDNSERVREEMQPDYGNVAYDSLHDPLTGLYNRTAYELLFKDSKQKHLALMIAVVDDFKYVSDRYGEAVADDAIKRIADVLRANYRSVDHICRISKDEFVVIVNRVGSDQKETITEKITRINETLQKQEDDVPPLSLSVGLAFADRTGPDEDVFENADKALRLMKEENRRGYNIYQK